MNTKYTKEQFDAAIRAGEDAFWEAFANHFPQADSGDFPIAAIDFMRHTLEACGRLWLTCNLPENTDTKPTQ